MALPTPPLLLLPLSGAAAGASPAGSEGDWDEVRPALPAEAPGSPAPSTAAAGEARAFFRGGGEAPPVSESEEEEAEARVSSPRAAVVGSRGGEEGEAGGRGGGGGGEGKAERGPVPPGGPGGSAAARSGLPLAMAAAAALSPRPAAPGARPAPLAARWVCLLSAQLQPNGVRAGTSQEIPILPPTHTSAARGWGWGMGPIGAGGRRWRGRPRGRG